MKFRPLYDRVVVKRLDAEEKTTGGLFLPETAKEKPQTAQIVAVGDGKVLDGGARRPVSVKVGDRVLLSKWSGDEVKVDGEEVIILKEDDILAVLS